VLCCGERAEAERALERASAFLRERLGLGLNPNPRPVVEAEAGFVFLGVYFIGDRRTIAGAKIESAKVQLGRLSHSEQDPAAALHKLSEAAAGWRRYYGAVVNEQELAVLEEPLCDAAAAVIARARAAGRITRLDEAVQLLGHFELLRTRPDGERKALLESLARRGLDRHSEGPLAAQARAEKTAPPRNRPARAGSIPLRHPRYRRGATSGASVGSVVRGRKREQLRRFAGVSDLVINTPGLFLGKASQRLIVRHQRRTVCEAPAERLGSVTFAGGGAALSADAVALCAERGTPIIFLSPSGQPLAVAQSPAWSDGELALLQLKAIEQGAPAFEIARRLVRGKIRAQANLIKYLAKYRRRLNGEFAAAGTRYLQEIETLLTELQGYQWEGNAELARGRLFSVEGRAAGSYWSLIGQVLGPRVAFEGRKRRGATDLVNSLLNYGYAVLRARVWCAAVGAGLNPHLGFLHVMEARRPSLIFDLMEEFRPCVVDRTVVTMLNRHQPLSVNNEGMLTEQSRRLLLAGLSERLATLVRWGGRERSLAEAIAAQAQALGAHLRGRSPYRAFSCKW
jgi:CRISPR-associated protein Cas1